MNFAEGKGPKQVKTTSFYPTGKFVTVYGNGDANNVNAAPVPFPSIVSGNLYNGLAYTYNGGIPGSAVPGLNLNINGNGNTDVGFVCSPGSTESIQDLIYTGVTLMAASGWTGSAVVTLQGTTSRYWDPDDYSNVASGLWNNITSMSGTVSAALTTYTLTPSGTIPVYNAYRLVASGTGVGIIDWAIAGMFTDFSAMRVGINATDTNGSIGQISIQMPRNITISGGQYGDNENAPGWEYAPGNPPVANTRANATYVQ